MSTVASEAAVGDEARPTRRLRRSSVESSLASSAAAAAPKAGSEKTGLRKRVSILFLKKKGSLRELASDYDVFPQSCSRSQRPKLRFPQLASTGDAPAELQGAEFTLSSTLVRPSVTEDLRIERRVVSADVSVPRASHSPTEHARNTHTQRHIAWTLTDTHARALPLSHTHRVSSLLSRMHK